MAYVYANTLAFVAHMHSCQQLFTLSFHIIVTIKIEEEFLYCFLGSHYEITP